MYCKHCGTENDDDAKYCKGCGKALVQPEPGATTNGPGHVGRTGSPPHVPNYLVQAILVTIFCCLPLGIVSIVYAAQVNGKVTSGDLEGALHASERAKLWAQISFGAAAAIAAIIFLFTLLGIVSNAY